MERYIPLARLCRATVANVTQFLPAEILLYGKHPTFFSDGPEAKLE
jgi:hypothetical protein